MLYGTSADVSRIFYFHFFLMHIQKGLCVITLFLLCKRTVLVFSIMTIITDTPGYNVEGFMSVPSSPSLTISSLIDNSHSSECDVMYHWLLIYNLLIISDTDNNFFICILTIWMSSWTNIYSDHSTLTSC